MRVMQSAKCVAKCVAKHVAKYLAKHVIASEAKQSGSDAVLDCFVALRFALRSSQ
jgi:hypothetical protein